MTETPTTITRARDILREMRAAATPGEWALRGSGSVVSEVGGVRRLAAFTGTGTQATSDTTLIVVLAGNPTFLDATDRMLAFVEAFGHDSLSVSREFAHYAERIASAIVSGYEAAQR